MSLRRGPAALVVAAAVALAGDSSAGILSSAGGKLAAGALEKIEPALAQTLDDVDATLTKHEAQIQRAAGSLIGQANTAVGETLDHTDAILEQRILQVQLGADEIIDRGLDTVNAAARARIAQINSALDHRIQQLDRSVADALNQADGILAHRLADVDRIVTGAVDRADGALAARIEQLDEVAARRLGNIDVIATKQRLGLERTILRVAWLIALIAFVVVVMKALWSEYLASSPQLASAAPGTERAWRYVALVGRPLLRHFVVGAAVAALLATVPQRLPMAAVTDQQDLVRYHAAELERSVAALDWTRVRFHAAQLEVLAPADIDRDRAIEARADLLQALLGKPTALATAAGAAAILDRVLAVERALAGQLDPDAATARAMILWQRGTTRTDEHEAATLAARALWTAPGGFTLSAMARIIIEAYLHAPDPSAPNDASLASAAGLAAVLATAAPDRPGPPFEAATQLFHWMAALDAASTPAFVAMVSAQARVAQAQGPARAAALAERNRRAHDVVAAWETFDQRLAAAPVLSGMPLVLDAFRLNDAVLCHALWFTTQPDTAAWPPALAALNTPGDRARKVAIAPARITWARRYAALLKGSARTLVEMQEAQRFETYERETLAFEASYGRLEGPRADPPRAPRAKAAPSLPPELPAAISAASIGLYQGTAGSRSSLALALAVRLANVGLAPGAQLDALHSSSDAVLDRLEVVLDTKVDDAASRAVAQLRALLATRGTQLM